MVNEVIKIATIFIVILAVAIGSSVGAVIMRTTLSKIMYTIYAASIATAFTVLANIWI